ncbi:hypothetical protein PRIPAC_88497 [Pristionchus pacificus]|uniref:Uncharacterized protein n=1 Tax=Pristionchus pacificus TaxID=54126 RepID=A0A2A6B816_PRIPA|nr:hypothetical protein PRIPAC_88497 [Pristionchus pacificus]|eukprot:PDM62016.1 hypothetical protein PRIPAC_51458 [Pristionchus pacificus]
MFNFALSMNAIVPYSGFSCGGPLCRIIENNSSLIAGLVSTSIVLHIPCYVFVVMHMHNATSKGLTNTLKLNNRRIAAVMAVVIAALAADVFGFAYFGRNSDDAVTIKNEPELRWLVNRTGNVLVFGPFGEAQHFKYADYAFLQKVPPSESRSSTIYMNRKLLIIRQLLKSTAAYCPTGSFTKCNSTMLVRQNCMMTCPYLRGMVAYRNATPNFITTKSLTCENGLMLNAEGKKITNLMRPTCAIRPSCNNCPEIKNEVDACPDGIECTAKYLSNNINPEDDCQRIICDRGILTMYASNKSMIYADQYLYYGRGMYCIVANRWQNYSLDGSIAGGTPYVDVNSVNCRFPIGCRSCTDPPVLITSANELPVNVSAMYEINVNAVRRADEDFECSNMTCASGYTPFFAHSSPKFDYTHLFELTCAVDGHWHYGHVYFKYISATGFLSSDVKFTCLRKL